MDPHHLRARDREHAEGVMAAQIGLQREREPGQIGERTQIAGMHSGGVEALAVEGRVGMGMAQRPFVRRNCKAWSSSREAV